MQCLMPSSMPKVQVLLAFLSFPVSYLRFLDVLQWRSDNGASGGGQRNGAEAATQVVAFQGMAGSMVQDVASALVPGCTSLPCEELDTAFHVLSQWAADKALLPIECNETGSFHAVYDLLLR